MGSRFPAWEPRFLSGEFQIPCRGITLSGLEIALPGLGIEVPGLEIAVPGLGIPDSLLGKRGSLKGKRDFLVENSVSWWHNSALKQVFYTFLLTNPRPRAVVAAFAAKRPQTCNRERSSSPEPASGYESS